MSKLSEVFQAQAEEKARTSGPASPDISEFDQAIAEVQEILRSDAPSPSSED